MSDGVNELLAEAQQAARGGDRERARSGFYAVIDREPDHLDAWLWLGAIAEDPEDSVAYLQRALEINPKSVRAQKGMEWAQKRLAEHRLAVVRPATPAPASETPSTVFPGLDTSGMEPMTQSLSEYKASIEEPTETASAPEPLPAPEPPPTPEPPPAAEADTGQETGTTEQLDWDAIMARLQAGEDGQPAGASAVEEGKRLIEAGNLQAAIAKLREAVAANPLGIEAHEQLGVALYQAGQSQEALSEFQAVAALDSRRAEAYANVGFIQAELGRTDAAIEAFRQAIASNPQLVEGYIALGDLLRGERRVDEAAEAYDCAVQLNAEIPEALYGLAVCRAERGQKTEAVVLLRRALALRSDFQEAQAKLKELE